MDGRRTRCRITPGLTDAEFDRIEERYGFAFADDHRGFLATGLPVNAPPPDEPGVHRAWRHPWPDWRDPGPELAVQLSRPTDSALDLPWWSASWGPEPGDPAEAAAVRRRRVAAGPRLVPVYGHRFLPAGRGTHGLPVLSVWHNLDVIVYGADLADYLAHEFGAVPPSSPRRPLPGFWQELVGED